MRNKKRKICVIITARPSYSRVKSVMKAIQDHPLLKLQIITTSSANLKRFGDVSEIIKNDGFNIDEQIFSLVEGESLVTSAKTTGLAIIELATVLDKLKPDAVITIADRYETLANAIAATYLNIPLVHLQGGDISGNIDEKVRHAITKLADIHFPTCENSKKRLILMGENPQKVFMLGDPALDIIGDVSLSKKLSFNPLKKYGGVGNLKIMPKDYYIVMQHSTTNDIHNSRRNITETLFAIQQLDRPVFVFWPNPDAGSDMTSNAIRRFREKEDTSNMHFFKNMLPADFLELLYHCQCLIGNSSVGIRECACLGVPVVNIGDRQANRDRGCNVIDVGYNRLEILNAIKTWEKRGRPMSTIQDGHFNAGEKIADTLATVDLSYTKRLCYEI